MSTALTAAITTTDTGLDELALVRLLHLVSPALPIGAFAWSQGLESVIDNAVTTDADSIERWVGGILRHNLTHLDLPLLLRLHCCALHQDVAALEYWNDYALASRETHELYQEDTQLGRALWQLLKRLEIRTHWTGTDEPISLLTTFAEAAVHARVPARATAIGWLWSWLENQMAVACKALPLGQTDAQRILQHLMPEVPACIERAAALNDDELGASYPGFAIVCSHHETQYSRLFRS